MIILGLGSNVGDRLDYLQQAVRMLAEKVMVITNVSSVYESEAYLKDHAPEEWKKPFLNMVVAGETHLSPESLLREVKRIEHDLGRQSLGVWSPREIDIDILSYNDQVVESEDLTIPHKHALDRCFVLLPLSEVAPNWRCPAGECQGKTAYELASNIETTTQKTEFSIGAIAA